MILTVDVGNTQIKIGAWDAGRLAFVARLQTNPLSTSDEYAVNLANLFALRDFNSRQFDGAIISCVVPQLSSVLVRAIQQVITLDRVMEVSPGLKTGLNIKIDDPATLGADMVCMGVAAMARYPQPTIILSLGTATAIFAINKQGEFLGGSVAPGIVISLNALSAKTAQLPYISVENPSRLIGKNTVESMKSGIIYGNACMIDGMVTRMREELGGEATVVATGGLVTAIIPYCRESIIVDETLILEGLRLIYHKNMAG